MLSHSDHSPENPWGLESLEPTNLVVLHPDETQPEQAAVLDALSEIWGQPLNILGSPEAEPDRDFKWLVVVELPKRPDGEFIPPLIIFAEPMREMPAEHLKHLNATHVKWTIGVETVLNPNDPLKSFHMLMKLFGKAFPSSPAILDVNKEGWHTRDEIDGEFVVDQEPTEASLFLVHGVCADDPPTPSSPMWIYTGGLARCGLPELEMLEVPHQFAGVAVSVLTSIGEIVIESGMPDPGEPFQIGGDLAITFQPWREVATFVGENSLGGLDRADHNGDPANGARAAVCAVEPTGTYKKIWTWPRHVLESVTNVGLTVLYRTQRGERRRGKLARHTWDDLAGIFAAIPSDAKLNGPQPQAVFIIRAGFHPQSRPDQRGATFDSWDGREHLWFEVKRFKGSRFEGVLVNEPISLANVRKGDVLWVDRGTISDWQVLTRAGVFSPSNVEAMRDQLATIVGQQMDVQPPSETPPR
jgi:hypothetical protein